VKLVYGSHYDAHLESTPRLYVSEEDMEIKDEQDERNKRAIDAALLGIKRSVEELRRLVDMAAALPPDEPALALVDGTLILWGLEAYPEFIISKLLKQEFLGAMADLKKLADERKIALASYISLPRGSDVVNAVRVAICPQESPNCDRCPLVDGKHACDIVSKIQDQMIFSSLLKQGERSALFFSQSSVVEQYYGDNRTYFFYLKAEDEIARVEVPEWAVRKEGLLDMIHAVVYDQCRRGQGYPAALSEAHEQAVVTGSDREEFWGLVEKSLVDEKIPVVDSIKSRSKRTRWL
jgi:hypothetical protein